MNRQRNVDDFRWHVGVNVIAASFAVGVERRRRLLRRAGIDVAEYAEIQPGCFFFGADASIGEASWINHRCYFDTRGPIHIGADCSIGMAVMFCGSGHEIGGPDRRGGAYVAEPIVVGDGTWIGARAVVLHGVTIGAGCVIGAGAVVTRDCEPHGLYAGVPARRVRGLPQAS